MNAGAMTPGIGACGGAVGSTASGGGVIQNGKLSPFWSGVCSGAWDPRQMTSQGAC